MGVSIRKKNGKDSLDYWVFITHRGKRKSICVGAKTAAEEVAAECEKQLALGVFDFQPVLKPPRRNVVFDTLATHAPPVVSACVGPCVYFVQQGKHGPVKIGYTANLRNRFATLQTVAFQKVRLLAAVPGWGRAEERALHLLFAPHRIHREWFTLSEELRIFICCLQFMRAHAQEDVGQALLREEGQKAVSGDLFAYVPS